MASSQLAAPQYLGLGNAIRVAVASYIGTAFEFYDFLMFGFVASTIAPLFFPSDDPTASLLSVLAVYWLGGATRPLGAIVFGHLGDTSLGRRNTLVLTILMMAFATLAMGLMPTFADIGVWAAVGMMLLRLLQGLSLGGEYGGAISFTLEHSPPKRRALFLGIVQMSASQSVLTATGMLAIVSGMMTAAEFSLYGWRWMFYIGFAIGLVGLVIRMALRESPIYAAAKTKKVLVRVPVREIFEKHWRTLLITTGIHTGGTVAIIIGSVFAVSYLISFIKTPAPLAAAAVAVGSIFGVVFTPVYGFLADKFGRRPIAILGYAGLLLFSYPSFLLLSTGNSTLIYISFIIVNIIGVASIQGITLMTEIWPTRVRYSGLSLSYQIPTSIFGGATPLIATYLIAATGFILAPVFWLVVASTVSLIASIIIRETRDIDITQ